MKNLCISSDQIGQFIQRMYEKGFRVEARPEESELCVNLPGGGYEWIKVFKECSLEDLFESFSTESSTNVDEQ